MHVEAEMHLLDLQAAERLFPIQTNVTVYLLAGMHAHALHFWRSSLMNRSASGC